jgi:hypothetical protein
MEKGTLSAAFAAQTAQVEMVIRKAVAAKLSIRAGWRARLFIIRSSEGRKNNSHQNIDHIL